MKNQVNQGNTLLYTNSGTAISSGDVVVVGATLWVAAVDIANGESGILKTNIVIDAPKVDAAEINVGETLLWDLDAGKFDDNAATAAAGDISGAAAVAMETKGATSDDTIRVKLTGVPGTIETGV